MKTFDLVHISCEMYPTTEEKALGGRAFMPETLFLLTGEIVIPKTSEKNNYILKSVTIQHCIVAAARPR